MKRITIDYILSLNPCYTREELEVMFKGRKYVYPKTIINEAKPADAQWLLLREDFFTKEQLEAMANKFAEHVKHLDNRYSRIAASWAAWSAARWARWAARMAPRDAELKWQMELMERYL